MLGLSRVWCIFGWYMILLYSVVHGTIYVSFMQVSTKDIIAQDILTHEAVYKHAKLLDQMCDGLKETLVYKLVMEFPQLFEPLFTFLRQISAEHVLDAIYTDQVELTPNDPLLMKYLRSFLSESDVNGN